MAVGGEDGSVGLHHSGQNDNRDFFAENGGEDSFTIKIINKTLDLLSSVEKGFGLT